MKNKQLKIHLETWQAHYDQKINTPNPAPNPIKQKSAASVSRVTARPAERVVGGEVLWKPIDRQAAMLVAKAPWYAHPPDELPITVSPKPKPSQENKSMSKSTMMVHAHAMDPSGPTPTKGYENIRTKMVNGEEMFYKVDIQRALTEQAAAMGQQLTPLARAAYDARAVLDENTETLQQAMDNFKVLTKGYLEEVRLSRFAVTSEATSILSALKDVRQFFIGNTHEQEMERLREFVAICERLRALKESGFLDTISDTIIKLSA